MQELLTLLVILEHQLLHVVRFQNRAGHIIIAVARFVIAATAVTAVIWVINIIWIHVLSALKGLIVRVIRISIICVALLALNR